MKIILTTYHPIDRDRARGGRGLPTWYIIIMTHVKERRERFTGGQRSRYNLYDFNQWAWLTHVVLAGWVR